MNKNEENSAKSSTWAEEQFRKEADELVKRLETDDRFDDFEPPEELFQKLVVEARDEGLLEEENTKHLEDETKSTEENTKENQNTKVVKFFNHRNKQKIPRHDRRSCDILLWIVWCEYEYTRRQELCYG